MMSSTHPASAPHLGWFGIVRLGLVQASLGAIVVLTTSTLNRVMVIELALPAMLPGLLVGLHYALQVLRPRWGYGSDRTQRRTPWIMGGMATLAIGGTLAAVATAVMASSVSLGVLLAIAAFVLIGVGVGASGTSLLLLLATRVHERRRPAAASIVWLMMIAGFVVTTITAGKLLDPFSTGRLVAVVSGVCATAFVVSVLALFGLEGPGVAAAETSRKPEAPFLTTLADVWTEPAARRFTIFIFVSMLAYSAQDLILEPFAGAVFGMTPGQSTQLGGLQHAGALVGMIAAAVAGSWAGRSAGAARRTRTMRHWMIGGCVASAAALVAIAMTGLATAAGQPALPLAPVVIVLGIANGAFAIAAIGSMMAMAVDGEGGRDGTRMGLWGAAQAVAFGLGGLAGTMAVDGSRLLLASPAAAYGSVFIGEAVMFLAAAALAAGLTLAPRGTARPDKPLEHGSFRPNASTAYPS
jgi:BCD family chlorophyll transporter-like MFS transporter